MHNESRKILEKHLAMVDRSSVSFGEKRAHDERVLKDTFILEVGAVLHKYGLKYSHDGKFASEAAARRLKSAKKQNE